MKKYLLVMLLAVMTMVAFALPEVEGLHKSPVKGNGGTTLVVPPLMLQTSTYGFVGFSWMDYSEARFDVQVGFDGNDVYIQGLCRYLPEAWVKGVMSGDLITFPKDQYLGEADVKDYYTGESLGLFPVWMNAQDNVTGAAADVILKVNPATGVMDALEEEAITFGNFDKMDFVDVLINLRLTPADAMSEVSYDLVEVPAEAETWGVDISLTSDALGATTAVGMMAQLGNDLYVMGITPDVPGWVKGTLEADGNVTFPKGQYLGQYRGLFDMWFMGVNPQDPSLALIDVKATWYADEKTLIFDNSTWIVENADPVSLYFADVLHDVEVSPVGDDYVLILPPSGMETTTYPTKVVSIGNYSYASSTYPVKVGFDGDDAYIGGLLYFSPNSWIKGKRNADGSLTFPKNQYIGTVQGHDVYVVPCDDDENILDEMTFKYDADKDAYTFDENSISFSIQPNTTAAVEIIQSVVINYQEESVESIAQQMDDKQPELTYYDLNGTQLSRPQSGINIVRASNGRTYRIVLK